MLHVSTLKFFLNLSQQSYRRSLTYNYCTVLPCLDFKQIYLQSFILTKHNILFADFLKHTEILLRPVIWNYFLFHFKTTWGICPTLTRIWSKSCFFQLHLSCISCFREKQWNLCFVLPSHLGKRLQPKENKINLRSLCISSLKNYSGIGYIIIHLSTVWASWAVDYACWKKLWRF